MKTRRFTQKKQTAILVQPHLPQNMGSRRGGFTLVELLVVVAIIAILAGLLLPTLARAKEEAIRTKCLSNVKQFTLGIIMYSQENRDQFPVAVGDNEPYDLPAFLSPMLVANGVTRNIMYDPGYPEFNNDSNWNDQPNVTRDIGYVLTFASTSSWIADTNQNPTMKVISPSTRVLLAGLVLSDIGQSATDPASRASYNYTRIAVDASPALLRCPHLKGKIAAGDNLGMMDGSAKWRNFPEMLPRNGPPSAGYDGNGDADDNGTGANPVCWW